MSFGSRCIVTWPASSKTLFLVTTSDARVVPKVPALPALVVLAPCSVSITTYIDERPSIRLLWHEVMKPAAPTTVPMRSARLNASSMMLTLTPLSVSLENDFAFTALSLDDLRRDEQHQ